MLKPNAKGKAALLVIAALIFLVVGFVCGQVAKGLNTLPGSADDPVATQSYVEAKVGESLATLTTRIEELEAELANLKGTGTPGATNNPGGTTNNPGGTTNPGATNNPGNTTSNATMTITGNGVRLRSGAGTSYEIITSLEKGAKVTRLGTEGDWYRVQTADGTVGYVSTSYAQ